MVVNADNQGSIALPKNPVFHDRSKHIDIQYHYTRNLVEEKKVRIEYIPTSDMPADLLTKSLPRPQHAHLSKGISLFMFHHLGSVCSEGVCQKCACFVTELQYHIVGYERTTADNRGQ